MPLQVSWIVENRIIHISSDGEVGDQDLLNIDPIMVDYINQSEAPLVHIILTGSASIPVGFKTVKSLEWPQHARFGWTVLVGLTNPLFRMIAAAGASLFKTRLRNVDTLEEALVFLQEVDSTLPSLEAK
jgi:hypothetical protein